MLQRTLVKLFLPASVEDQDRRCTYLYIRIPIVFPINLPTCIYSPIRSIKHARNWQDSSWSFLCYTLQRSYRASVTSIHLQRKFISSFFSFSKRFIFLSFSFGPSSYFLLEFVFVFSIFFNYLRRKFMVKWHPRFSSDVRANITANDLDLLLVDNLILSP